MSALGGIFHRGGGRPDRDTLAALSHSLRRLGPDGETFSSAGPVGMVYRPFHTFAASRGWQDPLLGEGGELLAWDGRLDNGDELVAALGLGVSSEEDDPRLALESWRRWGIEGLGRLVGDFALALWDPAAHRLVLARDAFGNRPLYYVSARDRFVWATSLQALLERPGAGAPEVDDEWIAEFFTRPEPSAVSPYRGIRTVMPGSALVVGQAGEALTNLWRFDPGLRIHLSGDGEYEERFRELFRQAVRTRLRAEGTVCAELSGGLDSSSIVCAADEILRMGEAEARELATISYVFDVARRSDERPFIRLVEEKTGRPGFHLKEEDHPILTPLPDGAFLEYPTPEHAYSARHQRVWEIQRRMGSRVLLSGFAGDQVAWGNARPVDLADLARQLRLARCLRHLIAWSRASGRPYMQLLWQETLQPLLPRRWKTSVGVLSKVIPEWVDPGFQREMNLADRLAGSRVIETFSQPSRRDHVLMLRRATVLASRGYFLAEGCIDLRHPFLHRPLVEFLVAIPLEQGVRPGETRSLMRRALRGMLPSEIASRTTKAGPGSAIHRAIAREWPRIEALLKDSRAAERGYVDAGRLRHAFERVRHGVSGDVLALINVLSLEGWLRFLSTVFLPANRRCRGSIHHRNFGSRKGGELMKTYETPEIFELGAVESLTFGPAIIDVEPDGEWTYYWSV